MLEVYSPGVSQCGLRYLQYLRYDMEYITMEYITMEYMMLRYNYGI